MNPALQKLQLIGRTERAFAQIAAVTEYNRGMSDAPDPPVWFRLLLIVMTVGGGFMGACMILQALLAGQKTSLSLLFYAVVLLLHLFVIAAGLMYVQSPRRLVPLIVAMVVQIPAVSSPFIEFRFGMGLIGFVGLAEAGPWLRFFVGSDWHLTWMQPLPWGIGINLAAFFVFCGLVYYRLRQHAVAKSIQPTPAPSPYKRLFPD